MCQGGLVSVRRALLGCVLALAAVGLVPVNAHAESGSGTVRTSVSGAGQQRCGLKVIIRGFAHAQSGTVAVSRLAPNGSGLIAQRRAALRDGNVLFFGPSELGLMGAAPKARGWHLRVVVRADNGKRASTSLWLSCASLRSRAMAVPTMAQRALPQTRMKQAVAAPAQRPQAYVARSKAAPSKVLPTGTIPHVEERVTAGSIAPRPVSHEPGWFEVKLLLSLLAATLITGRLVTWTAPRRVVPARPVL
jgi:hypothetical protein